MCRSFPARKNLIYKNSSSFGNLLVGIWRDLQSMEAVEDKSLQLMTYVQRASHEADGGRGITEGSICRSFEVSSILELCMVGCQFVN